jgi:hypothetical protein
MWLRQGWMSRHGPQSQHRPKLSPSPIVFVVGVFLVVTTLLDRNLTAVEAFSDQTVHPCYYYAQLRHVERQTRHLVVCENPASYSSIRRSTSSTLPKTTMQLFDLSPIHHSASSADSGTPLQVVVAGRMSWQNLWKWLVMGFSTCLGLALLIISWEDISITMTHPLRQETALARVTKKDKSNMLFSTTTITTTTWGQATVRGMAFGWEDRMAALKAATITVTESESSDMSSENDNSNLLDLPSYNEILWKHRSERVPLWRSWHNQPHQRLIKPVQMIITRQDVEESVRNIQLALLTLQECKILTADYQWDRIRGMMLNQQSTFRLTLDSSCYLLQQADSFLSIDARQVIGFDWGSCAWRHCGALADAQEALDELDHLLGVLQPFECLFCLDIIERSLRDILDVIPPTLHSPDLQSQIMVYQPIQRRSDVNQDTNLDGLDMDFVDALNMVKNMQL